MNGYFIILLMVLCLAIGAGGTYLVKNEFDKVKLAHDISDQKDADTKSCNADKQITEKANAKAQADINNLNQRVAVLSSVPAHCVPVVSSSAKPVNAKGQPGQVTANAGLNSGWLIKFAASCERDRLQLNDLIDFVNAVRASK